MTERDPVIARFAELVERARTAYERGLADGRASKAELDAQFTKGFEEGAQHEREKYLAAIEALDSEPAVVETLAPPAEADGNSEVPIWQQAHEWLQTKAYGATIADASAEKGFNDATLPNLVYKGRARSEGDRPKRYFALELLEVGD